MIEAIDFKSSNASKLFVESLQTTGFGVLTNHPLSQERIENIYAHWADFFNSDMKHGYSYNKNTQDGYFPASVSETAKGHSQKDIKEYYHIYPWGKIPEHLKDEILDYYAEANHFAKTLLRWVQTHTPKEVSSQFSVPLSNMVTDSPNTLLRVLHYPALEGNEEPGAFRAAAHEDINLLTILPAANEPGLQLLSKEGQWIDVPCDYGSVIVNIGDMLQEASQGYFPSTSHRVINPENMDANKARLSLPLFLHPRSDVRLSTKHTQRSYLMERLKELGVI